MVYVDFYAASRLLRSIGTRVIINNDIDVAINETKINPMRPVKFLGIGIPYTVVWFLMVVCLFF